MLYEIHLWGIYAIEVLQFRLSMLEQFFKFLSSVGDPSQLYVVYFPFIFPFFPNLGFKLLLAAAVGEWINFLMKWVFHGDRPYWWIEENNLKSHVKMNQFYNTCETGPGMPSGHVTLTTMIYYLLMCHFINLWKVKSNIKCILWMFYATLIFLMGVSRVFIATHFPHQCILGFLSGLPLAKLIYELNLNRFQFHHYVLLSLATLGSAYGLEGILTVLGIDVAWSVQMAEKWCLNRSWVHITTSPYYVTWRYAATIFGLGLVRRSLNYKRIIEAKYSFAHKILLAFSGLFISHLILFIVTKMSLDSFLLYISTFIMYAFIPYAVVILLPVALSYS